MSACEDPPAALPDIRARQVDPATFFQGPVLVLAPHSDDEALGCGGTIAQLAPQVPVHVAYATDGRMSPPGPDGGPAPNADQIVQERRQEARNAMALLGVPSENLHFLDLPDGRLAASQPHLETGLAGLLGRVRPMTVLAPFRHDQHPDHLAVHRAARRVLRSAPQVRLAQYFIYRRFPFGTVSDIRQALDPRVLVRVDIDGNRAMKRQALDLYPSQVTAHYPWQSRPSLSRQFIEENCAGDEVFAVFDAAMSDRALFATRSPRFWIGLYLAPRAVQWKKRLIKTRPIG